MVVYLMKWDIRPEKEEAYQEWTKSAIGGLLAAPGMVEFRAFRTVMGCHQVAVMCEFTDLQTWGSWQENEDTKKIWEQGRRYMTNISMELLGPSPIVPEPLRPGQ
jgi:heme-degrading monooxygenase HmoA